MSDRLFRKEFGNRESENPGNYRILSKIDEFGPESGKIGICRLNLDRKTSLDSLEWFLGPKTPKNVKKTRKVRDFGGRVPMTWISPLIWGETILKFRTGG